MKNISPSKGFASDNNSGISPEVIEAIVSANKGHVIGYGDDPYTEHATHLFKQHFGETAIPFFLFTGTAANVLGITGITDSYHAVICAETAHINEDECGAPEKFSGCKLLPIHTNNGKLTPELLFPYLATLGIEHHSQPKVISISQPTELGTVYTVDELKRLSDFADLHNLLLHIDGARLANAAVSLNLPFKAFTADIGVDILSFGGTKNGLLAAESVVFFDSALAKSFKFIRKQGMQGISKMRYISAQFIAYLEGDLWKRNATHANLMAQKMYEAIKDIPQIRITQKVEANGLFVAIPKEIIPTLRNEFFFYDWNRTTGEVRWMCSFDTTENEIDRFVNLLTKTLEIKR